MGNLYYSSINYKCYRKNTNFEYIKYSIFIDILFNSNKELSILFEKAHKKLLVFLYLTYIFLV